MGLISYGYRLRTSGPFPTLDGLVSHTFMAEKREIETFEATTTINKSDEMAGIVGSSGFESTRWNSLNYMSGDKIVFSGETVVLIDPAMPEGDIPGSCT